MDKLRVLFLTAAIFVALTLASSGATAFIGAGINLNKQFGNSINFNLGKNIGVGNSAFGLAGMNIGVDWGVDYDINALAGYPYGYGGVGSVTDGNLGYFINLNMDAVQGSGFNGADWGVPMAQQGVTTTHYGKSIAEQAHLNDVQVAMPWG
jgi:hypothetical protein